LATPAPRTPAARAPTPEDELELAQRQRHYEEDF
jgi:hypothetical protein